MKEREKALEILEIMCEMTSLSKMPRIGWLLAGVNDAESISDHCYETALIAYFLSKNIDYHVDLGKVLMMALFHEVGETRLSDLPRRAKPYVKSFKKEGEKDIAIDVLGNYAEEINAILDEFEEKKTLEACLTEAAEELQIIFKSLIYAKENNGDMSEYRQDVKRYNSYEIDIAHEISKIIDEKLNGYLDNKPYWEIGYKRK